MLKLCATFGIVAFVGILGFGRNAIAQEGESLFEKTPEVKPVTPAITPTITKPSPDAPKSFDLPIQPMAPPPPKADIIDSTFQENRIDALHYRVPKRKFSLETHAQSTLQSEILSSRSGQTADHIYSTQILEAEVRYGFLDNLFLKLNENYEVRSVDKVKNSNGTSQDYQFSGYSDPTLGLDYRFLGGLSGDWFGSVFVEYSQSLGSNRPATVSKAGNYLQGYSSLSFGVQGNGVLGPHEWVVIGKLVYQGSGTGGTDNPADAASQTGSTRYVGDLGYRFHFQKSFFVSFNLDIESEYVTTTTFSGQTPPVAQDVRRSGRVIPNLSIGWRVLESALLQTSYSLQSYSQDITPTSGANLTTTNDQFTHQLLTVGGVVEF